MHRKVAGMGVLIICASFPFFRRRRALYVSLKATWSSYPACVPCFPCFIIIHVEFPRNGSQRCLRDQKLFQTQQASVQYASQHLNVCACHFQCIQTRISTKKSHEAFHHSSFMPFALSFRQILSFKRYAKRQRCVY